MPRLASKQPRVDNVISQDAALNMVLDQLRPVGCFLGEFGFNLAPLDRLSGPLGGRGRSLGFFNLEVFILLWICVSEC